MANKRVTDLPQAEKMLDGDILHIIQSGIDKQIPANKVGGGGVKQGTRAEIDAMILSGEIEEGDSYIVNDEEAMYNPADLNDIRSDIEELQENRTPCLDWANRQSISADTSFTCPKNGIVYGQAVGNAKGGYVLIASESAPIIGPNNTNYKAISQAYETGNALMCYYPTYKGEVVRVRTSNIVSGSFVGTFVPWK